MQRRYLTIPPSITIDLDAGGSLPFAFVENLVLRTLTRDPKMGVTLANLHTAIELRAAFTGKLPGDVVELDEEQWALLAAVAAAPSGAYIPEVMIPAIAMLDTIRDAPTKDPRPSNGAEARTTQAHAES